MTPRVLWLTILGMGVMTYALRLSMIALLARAEMPDLVRRALRFVPPAVLSALILPEMVRPGGVLDLSPGNDRLVAGVLAVVVAWRTRNVFLTIGVGMAALWLLQAIR